jgi:hypothetical protein
MYLGVYWGDLAGAGPCRSSPAATGHNGRLQFAAPLLLAEALPAKQSAHARTCQVLKTPAPGLQPVVRLSALALSPAPTVSLFWPCTLYPPSDLANLQSESRLTSHNLLRTMD